MTSVVTLIGGLLIAVTLIDVFHTLFHPGKRGTLSDWIARGIWKLFRNLAKGQPKLLSYAGPCAILVTIITWVSLTWFGFALIYFPRLSYGFAYESGVVAAQSGGFGEALNVSLGELITEPVGVSPKSAYLRFLSGFEAVIGFGLLTASVSWLLSVYPVLEARRSVAERATLLHHAERANAFDVTDPQIPQAPDWLIALGADLANLRNQLSQFPIAYYFYIGEHQTALSGALSYLLQIADRATEPSRPPAMRLAGTVLGGAVHNFLELIAGEFLHMPSHDKPAILLAYAHEQMADLLFRDHTIPNPRRAA